MEEWKIYRLGDLVDFQNGYAFKSSKFLYDGKYKIIRIKELKNGLVKFFEDTVSISDEPNEILSKILVNKGDVIFALTGDPVSKQNANSWVGRVSLYTHDIPAYLNQRTCKIIQCNNVVPQYVYYYFRQYENLYSLASKATGSASQANISTKILEDTEILLPSLSVQKKMVAILASLDNKIALNRRINENLEQQAQALFKSWFVDGTNIELNYHELGNITSITAGGDKPSIYSKELTEKYYTPIYSNGIENEGLYGYTDFAKINSSSITISARGTIGYICLRTKPYVPIVRLISVIPKKEELSAEYLYLWALRQNFSATGTTQQQLTVPNLKKISIGIPAKEILKKFNNIVIPIFQSIEKNKDENKNLAQLRDTLLPKLMSGELKLSEIKTKLYE